MTSLSETLRDLSPTDRVRVQLERLPDSDAVTLDKGDVRALLDEAERLRLDNDVLRERLRDEAQAHADELSGVYAHFQEMD